MSNEEMEEAKPDKAPAHGKRELNVPGPVVTLIALLFTGAMLWNVIVGGEGIVTVALASAVPFIIGVPMGVRLMNGGNS